MVGAVDGRCLFQPFERCLAGPRSESVGGGGRGGEEWGNNMALSECPTSRPAGICALWPPLTGSLGRIERSNSNCTFWSFNVRPQPSWSGHHWMPSHRSFVFRRGIIRLSLAPALAPLSFLPPLGMIKGNDLIF